MTRDARGTIPLPLRLLLIAAATFAMAGGIASYTRSRSPRARVDAPVDSSSTIVVAATAPIAGEAQVFTANVAAPSTTPTPPRRSSAHPRTLATYRGLRAYPGAPPRIPHGLTRNELRGAGCNTCHERGGYAQRFEAYAPVTPHPEFGDCLQCHLADARVAGITLPPSIGDDRPDALCRQCHAIPLGKLPRPAGWSSAAWPSIRSVAPGAQPPSIPHELFTRGNCLACHAGPAAVAEIRTSHPERSNCRQCHLRIDDSNAEPAVLDASPRTQRGAR